MTSALFRLGVWYVLIIGGLIGLTFVMMDTVRFYTQKLAPVTCIVENRECSLIDCIVYVSYFINSTHYQSNFKTFSIYNGENVTICHSVNSPRVLYDVYKPSTNSCGIDIMSFVTRLFFVLDLILIILLSIQSARHYYSLYKRQYMPVTIQNINREIELQP